MGSVQDGGKPTGLIHLSKRNFRNIFRNLLDYLGFLKSRKTNKVDKYNDIFIDRMYSKWRVLGDANFILYLKTSLYALNSYLGGNPLKHTTHQGIRVKLSHGLPWIIPDVWRREIRNGNLTHIHIVSSVLYSYKGINAIYKEPSFESIKQPHPVITGFGPFLYFAMKQASRWAIKTPWKIEDRTQRELRILSAGPNNNISQTGCRQDAYALFTHYPGILESMRNFAKWTGHTHFDELFSEEAFERYVNNRVDQIKWFIPNPTDPKKEIKQLYTKDEWVTGKLSLKMEAAGKVRVFAIGDYYSQWLLRPLHDYMFSILRKIPEDATFDQEGRLNDFVKANIDKKFFSYDLKSATDTISRRLYVPILAGLIGFDAAEAWSEIMNRPFRLPKSVIPKDCKPGEDMIEYGTGQPMGMYSSWAALALFHHVLVRYAYYLLYPDGRMPPHMYIVLGDDIAIADKELAEKYLSVAQDFSIPISIAKSFTDSNILNFASQFISNKGVNLTPLPVKELLSAKSLDRKAELGHRLVRRGFIQDGLTNLFRTFFVPSSWKKEVRYMCTGTLSLYGRKAYRVLLQPNGYNNLTLLDFTLGFTPKVNLSNAPKLGFPLRQEARTGFINRSMSQAEQTAHTLAYFIYEELTAEWFKWIESTVENISMGPKGFYVQMLQSNKKWKLSGHGNPAVNSIFRTDTLYEHFQTEVLEIIEKKRTQLMNLGYDENGFNPDLHLTEFFKFVSHLPIIYNPYHPEAIFAQVKEQRRLSSYEMFGQMNLYSRFLSRKLLRNIAIKLPGLEDLSFDRISSKRKFRNCKTKLVSPK